MSTRAHWETVYATKDTTRVSWFQRDPAMSLRQIDAARADRSS